MRQKHGNADCTAPRANEFQTKIQNNKNCIKQYNNLKKYNQNK